MKARDFISEAPLRLKNGGRVNTGRRQQKSMRDWSLTPGGSGNAAIERTKARQQQARQSTRGSNGQPSVGNMRRGSSGNSVSQLQTSLQNMGYDIGSTGADGKFGKNTRAAVMKFQKDNGLKVDGIVGPNTRAAMQKAAQASQPSSTPAGTPGAGHPGEQSIYNTPKQTSNGPSFRSNVPDMKSGSFNVAGADPGAIPKPSTSTKPNPLKLASMNGDVADFKRNAKSRAYQPSLQRTRDGMKNLTKTYTTGASRDPNSIIARSDAAFNDPRSTNAEYNNDTRGIDSSQFRTNNPAAALSRAKASNDQVRMGKINTELSKPGGGTIADPRTTLGRNNPINPTPGIGPSQQRLDSLKNRKSGAGTASSS